MILKRKLAINLLLVYFWSHSSVEGLSVSQSLTGNLTRQRASVRCYLVTEEDVFKAVEQAEALWAEALEARKTANALSDRAEEEAEAAASSAEEVNEMFKNRENPISMQQLAQADAAARSNLDAGSMVNKALEASDEADRLEKLAEEALQRSEEQLEQHLKDCPESPLA